MQIFPISRGHLRIRCVFVAVLCAVSVLLSGCASFADKFGMAILAAQTVNALKEHDSMQMTATLNGTMSGELPNVKGPFGINIGNVSLSADADTALSLKEVQDPFSLTYDGATNITMFNYSIPIPHRGSIAAEGDHVYLDTHVGDTHDRNLIDADAAASILLIQECKSMSSLKWFGFLATVFGAVMNDSFVATLNDQHVDISGQECYAVTIPVEKELLQKVIESLLSGSNKGVAADDSSEVGADNSSTSGDDNILLRFDHADWSKAKNNIVLYISTETKLPVRAVLEIGTISDLTLNPVLLENDLMQLVNIEGDITIQLKKLKATVDVVQ